eukprot:Platyproteum_vivax@DN8329_c0_g1_i1.p1
MVIRALFICLLLLVGIIGISGRVNGIQSSSGGRYGKRLTGFIQRKNPNSIPGDERQKKRHVVSSPARRVAAVPRAEEKVPAAAAGGGGEEDANWTGVVTTHDLADSIASETKLPLADVEQVVKLTFAKISEAMSQRKRVTLRNFGAFNMVSRSARQYRRIDTGEKYTVPERELPHFEFSPNMRKLTAG